jgi:hypothetical protein
MVAISNGYRNVRKPELVVVPKVEPPPPPPPAPEQDQDRDMDALRQQLLDLQKRVSKLEKPAQPWEATVRATTKNAKAVIDVVCAIWGVSYGDLIGPRRARVLAVPRFAVAYLFRQHCKHMSLPMMGEVLRRDHTSILHGLRRAEELLKQDQIFINNMLGAEAALRAVSEGGNG